MSFCRTAVLRSWWNTGNERCGWHSLSGRLFHSLGPATENFLSLNLLSVLENNQCSDVTWSRSECASTHVWERAGNSHQLCMVVPLHPATDEPAPWPWRWLAHGMGASAVAATVVWRVTILAFVIFQACVDAAGNTVWCEFVGTGGDVCIDS